MPRLIHRRDVLRLAALAAAPVRASSQPSAGTASPPETVVVVGGGLSGLRAADVLQSAGRAVVVLEASDRPGGRVLTVRSPFDEGLYAEAGAIRISALHRTVLSLAREHGLMLVPFDSPTGASVVSIGASTARSDERLQRSGLAVGLRPEERGFTPRGLLEHYVGDLAHDLSDPTAPDRSYLSQPWRAYDRQTWPQWLQQRGASPAALKIMTAGADSSQLSALYILRQFALLARSPLFLKIKGGLDLLPKALAARLGPSIRYRSEVVRIVRGRSSIRVDTLEGGSPRSVVARDVVLAVPFSTLRRVDIQPPFSPAKMQMISQLPYLPATRFLLQTRQRFWTASGRNGSARTDRGVEVWDCSYDLAAQRGILGATAGGAPGLLTASMTEAQCLAFGRDAVAQAFPELPLNLERGLTYRWTREAWARGAFAAFRPGQMTAFMPEIARPEGRVHFAGEHTSSWMGWMEGALESGERAAREILDGADRP